MRPHDILREKFGFSSFRLEQERIIENVLLKKDTLAIMPTGGGKSLCFQIPALLMSGLTIVISPLIALMKDQVDALRVNGIPAAFLNSTQNAKEQGEILARIRAGELKLLYLAPESAFIKQLLNFQVDLIAIDEAHCISHWGHDFRPEYLKLAHLKKSFPQIPVIALTATADRLTQKDIVEKLGLSNPAVFISSFNRANIRYTVEKKEDSFRKLLAFLRERRDDPGIIYCLSRASTERLANDLTREGIQALPYHAGLEKDVRSRHQDQFLRDEIKIIVATIAFGMGIDKSNVRFVVHMDLPKNIEGYYQETGRAGRDGLSSEALLFYSYGDVAKLKRFVEIDDNPEQTEIYLRKLNQMARYGNLTTCRRKYLLNYFDEKSPDHCGNCDVCLNSLGRSGSIRPTTAANNLPFDDMLFKVLKDTRRQIANKENVPAYIVLSDASLAEVATYLPTSRQDFFKISGFGSVKVERYAQTFGQVVADYCRTQGINSRMHLKKPKPPRQEKTEIETETKQRSLALFRKGISIQEIAESRNLAVSTIEGHLAFYIQQGQLSIDEAMDTGKIPAIQEAIEKTGGTLLNPVKTLLGENFSYGEIRMVMAHLERSRV